MAHWKRHFKSDLKQYVPHKALLSVSASTRKEEPHKRKARYTGSDSEMHDDDSLKNDPNLPEMRKLLFMSTVETGTAYLIKLNYLVKLRVELRDTLNTQNSVISAEDIDTIFFKIPELYQVHSDFLKDIESKLELYTGETPFADCFAKLATEECSVAEEYLKNYKTAISTVQKYYRERPQFIKTLKRFRRDVSTTAQTFTEILHEPVVQFQRNILVLNDLIKLTPTCHPDYDTLQKTNRIRQKFLENVSSMNCDFHYSKDQRYLVKCEDIVELIQPGNTKKLRHIFIFNDIIVCSKEKLSRERVTYTVKWVIPLSSLQIVDDTQVADVLLEKHLTKSEKLHGQVKDKWKELIKEQNLKEIRNNQKLNIWTHKYMLPKLKKNLCEQKQKLFLSTSHLVLRLKNVDTDMSYYLLHRSDSERTAWKEFITDLQHKNPSTGPTSLPEITSLINSLKLPYISQELKNTKLEERFLFGELAVTVHKLCGLQTEMKLYCSIELDSFSHFFKRGRTESISSVQPVWNERLEMDLEGTQQLRVLLYEELEETHNLIGIGALKLSKDLINRNSNDQQVMDLGRSLTIFLSIKEVKPEESDPPTLTTAIFGVNLSTLSKREDTKVPNVVKMCVAEIERRGLEERGIYHRTTCVTELNELENSINKSISAADVAKILQNTTILHVSCLLMRFFRKLPDPLFSNAAFITLSKGLRLTNEHAKEKLMMTAFKSLPDPYYSTALFLFSHLHRVLQFEHINQMNSHLLAAVFSSCLFSTQNPSLIEQALIVKYFLNVWKRSIKESAV